MNKKRWVILGVIISLLSASVLGASYWRGNVVDQLSNNVIAVPEKSVEMENNTINVLLLGSDARGDEIGRTDSIMFLSANVKTKKVSIISIPRDTRVEVPGVGLTKITHANVIGGKEQGVGTIVQTASNLLEVPINNYVVINFEGFKSLVDALGGVDIELPTAINDYMQNIYLPAGSNHLDGEQALRLARVRYSLPDGDFGRQWYQYKLLAAIAEEALKAENISKLPQIYKIVSGELLETNMTQVQMLALASKFTGFSSKNIEYYQIPGKSLTAHDPLVGANVYYFEANKAELEAIVRKSVNSNA